MTRSPRPSIPTGLVADAWALALAVVLAHRMLFGSGYGLARDMVFSPQQPLTPEVLGLGSGSARAVPLDAVVGVLEHVVDGTWVGRFAIVAFLALAGCGARRLVKAWSLPSQLLTAGLAVWNPFVIERLALGQWALLSSYAALPWLIRAVRRYRTGERRIGPVLGWLLLASLTPTGGLIGVGSVLVLGLGRDRRRSAGVVLAAVITQLPWIVPSLLNTAAVTSDPGAVAAFAARSERAGGPLLSLLGFGGIWDSTSAPDSRAGVLGYLTTAAVVVALVLGLLLLARRRSGSALPRLVALAAGGFVLAAASSVPGLDAVVRWVVANVPGAGLLRDSQKWLEPFVLLVVLCAGECAQWVIERMAAADSERRREVVGLAAVVACVIPVLLLPDALAATRNTLTPVHYPDDFTAVADRVDGHGVVLTLPLSGYRLFSWGAPVPVADPAAHWFDDRVIVSDELAVGNTVLKGEDPLVARIAHGLASSESTRDALASAGVDWVVVYRDAAGASALRLTGLEPAYTGRYLALYRVPGPVVRASSPSSGEVATVVAVDFLGLAWAIGDALATGARTARRRARSRPQG